MWIADREAFRCIPGKAFKANPIMVWVRPTEASAFRLQLGRSPLPLPLEEPDDLSRLRLHVRRFLPDRPGELEIDQTWMPVPTDSNVPRVDVSVDDAGLVESSIRRNDTFPEDQISPTLDSMEPGIGFVTRVGVGGAPALTFPRLSTLKAGAVVRHIASQARSSRR